MQLQADGTGKIFVATAISIRQVGYRCPALVHNSTSPANATSTDNRQQFVNVSDNFLYPCVLKTRALTLKCTRILHYFIFFGFQLLGAQNQAVIPLQYWTGKPLLQRPKNKNHQAFCLTGTFHLHGVLPRSNIVTKAAVPRRMRRNKVKVGMFDVWMTIHNSRNSGPRLVACVWTSTGRRHHTTTSN